MVSFRMLDGIVESMIWMSIDLKLWIPCNNRCSSAAQHEDIESFFCVREWSVSGICPRWTAHDVQQQSLNKRNLQHHVNNWHETADQLITLWSSAVWIPSVTNFLDLQCRWSAIELDGDNTLNPWKVCFCWALQPGLGISNLWSDVFELRGDIWQKFIRIRFS